MTTISATSFSRKIAPYFVVSLVPLASGNAAAQGVVIDQRYSPSELARVVSLIEKERFTQSEANQFYELKGYINGVLDAKIANEALSASAGHAERLERCTVSIGRDELTGDVARGIRASLTSSRPPIDLSYRTVSAAIDMVCLLRPFK